MFKECNESVCLGEYYGIYNIQQRVSPQKHTHHQIITNGDFNICIYVWDLSAKTLCDFYVQKIGFVPRAKGS